MKALWASVARLALMDCLGNSYAWSRAGGYDRPSAQSFCLAEQGDWKRAREFVCDLAGLDADSFRERALKLLADANPLPRPTPR